MDGHLVRQPRVRRGPPGALHAGGSQDRQQPCELSVAGYRGLPGRTGYSASKFAVNGFLEALRTELLDTGVNVMWVCPGFTASNIRNAALIKDGSQQGKTPLDEQSLMTAEECAALTIKAIEKRKRTLIYTVADKRTVWLNKLFPSLTDKLVRNHFFKNGTMVK